MNEPEIVDSDRELLLPGCLYTIGRLSVSCVRHEPGKKPRLKLKLYPAWFVEAMATMKTFDSFHKEQAKP